MNKTNQSRHKCDNCGEPATIYQKDFKDWRTIHHVLQNGEWVETETTVKENDFCFEHFYCEDCGA